MCCGGERIKPGLHLPESGVIADPGVGRLRGRHKWVVVQVLLSVAHQPAGEKLHIRMNC